MELYTGVVENRDDPLRVGRCQVRILGLHTEDKTALPTADLPWAYPMQPVTSAAVSGIGWTPVGPVLGTWVVIMFRDEDQQQPIMLGTIGGIPQTKAAELAKEESSDGILATSGGILTDGAGNAVTDGSGNPIQVGTAEASGKSLPNAPSSADAAKPDIAEQPVPNKPSDEALKQSIPTKPPTGSTPNASAAEKNIKLLIEACDKVGLTSKYAKCAILGICGGESGWLVVEEGSYYSKADSLSKIFRRTFPTPESAEPFVKWQGTKADFFRKIYSPEGNGSLLGHKDPEDGAKYYGRGFNQITGKSLYQQLQKYLAGKGIAVDLVNKPESILEDPSVGALATAAFYALNVKHDQNDPGYFQSALKRTGNDANGTGYAKKQRYYEYFLGDTVTVESTNKPTADEQKVYTKEEVKDLPPAKQTALLEDRSSSANIGFQDPQGKYPLRNLMDEPDTNRLSRGVIKETAIEFKDTTRTKQIPIANDSETWEQPIAPFGGKYPYSKVYETESGHLFVLDDTPTHENISLYHRKGSFLDIDANGTQVNKIVGDGYTIIDKNGSIFIGGRCLLTVGNGVSILVQGNADIEVEGSSVVNLKGQADIGVALDCNLAVGGDLKTKVVGDFTVEATNINMIATEAHNTNAGTSINVKAGESMNMLAGADTKITSNGAMDIKSGGAMKVDYSRGDFGNGAASAEIENSPVTGLTPPAEGNPRSNQFGYLQTPVRPSPPVELKYAIAEENEALVDAYIANPSAYKNPEAANNGVKENYAGTPKDDGVGKSLKSESAPGDIQAFLQKQLELTAQSKYWVETGMGGNKSNPNITRIWADLGYPTSGMWATDQTAWCMGFVNWTLKQCGYRYVQTASAKEIGNNPQRWGATKVSIEDAQPGDIVLWNFSHVNFVYTARDGKLTFVGGNQGGKSKDNNPSSGDVTNSWAGGWSQNRGGIVAIYRPSRV
jgi:predicted chitinase